MKKFLLILVILTTQYSIGQKKSLNKLPPKLAKDSLQSAQMENALKYYVYLPDAYETEESAHFPVIYWLHGSGGWPPGALNMLSGRFHGAIMAQKIPPAIVVFLDDGHGGSMWVDWKDGTYKMESVIIQELIPYIDKSYRTIPEKSGRIMEGGSMGGYGTARLGLKYPELFSAISMLNPGPMQEVLDPEKAPIVGRERARKTLEMVYGGEIEYFKALSPWQIAAEYAEEVNKNLRIRIILGAKDPIVKVNQSFSERLNGLGIKHQLVVIENAGHSPREMFAGLGEDYWAFFNDALTQKE
jgi:enterochelin esterase-like enzyme